jgi:protocatechuate 3,4-dioxygenase beta subunit
VYESPVPFTELPATDTLPGFFEPGQKLFVSGVVYRPDGVTPAADVVLYLYQTDQNGLYTPHAGATGWAARHGYIRGWLKTGADGRYGFYTLRPRHYPNSDIPEHIHPTVKEPDKNEYYLDDYNFDDDPLLTPAERAKLPQRGGSGIVALQPGTPGMMTATRDIVLGKNIPDYPK